MTKTRKKYSKKFKQKAIELSNVCGNTQQIARELGISDLLPTKSSLFIQSGTLNYLKIKTKTNLALQLVPKALA